MSTRYTIEPDAPPHGPLFVVIDNQRENPSESPVCFGCTMEEAERIAALLNKADGIPTEEIGKRVATISRPIIRPSFSIEDD